MNGIELVERLVTMPGRAADAHKGDFGRVLVVGGSRGMVGAVALAANAALRGGAGLVTFAAPETIQLSVATLCPCATSIPLTCNVDGGLSAKAVRQILTAADACDVLAVGPGMGVGMVQRNIVQSVLEQARPVVLDADGLNHLAGIEDWPARRRCRLVLTPHPGEFGRLRDMAIADVQADRVQQAAAAARQWTDVRTEDCPDLVCVLKGAGTVVTDGGRAYVNKTGNPGMATGGSGDVLTGLIAALIGQGLSPFDAACLGVNVHGSAGDLAAGQLGQASLTASDILENLPAALQRAGA